MAGNANPLDPNGGSGGASASRASGGGGFRGGDFGTGKSIGSPSRSSSNTNVSVSSPKSSNGSSSENRELTSKAQRIESDRKKDNTDLLRTIGQFVPGQDAAWKANEAIKKGDYALAFLYYTQSFIETAWITYSVLEIVNSSLSRSSSSSSKIQSVSSETGISLENLFQGGRVAKASEVINYAETQGWTVAKTATGPLKYIDKNGIVRLTIKKGSPRTVGSELPHLEIRNASGQRVDIWGNAVSKRSVQNHVRIIYDIK